MEEEKEPAEQAAGEEKVKQRMPELPLDWLVQPDGRPMPSTVVGRTEVRKMFDGEAVAVKLYDFKGLPWGVIVLYEDAAKRHSDEVLLNIS